MIDNRVFYKRLWQLSLPFVLQSLMLALVAACDALMLGQVAQEQMTAVSLASQVQFVQNLFLWAILGAGAILGAQYFGKRDLNTIQSLFNMILRLCGLVSIVFFAACELIPDQLMHIFTHDEELISIGSEYLRIAGWSYLLTGISESYLTIMRVTDHATATAVISSTAVGLNIVFNDDEATSIIDIASGTVIRDGIYDLSGRKVTKPAKGFYIVNGKKAAFGF